MNIYQILQKKRFGKNLENDEIAFLINGLLDNSVSREQIAVFLMASCINGMNFNEISYLTEAMANSGKKFNFKNLGKPIADKHSTGGVGDKISLLLVPILISLDVAVPMISGRGLGHTGGTVDKMESILGYRTLLSDDEIYLQMEKIGGMIIAQTSDIAPADKIIYSIRDVTATVESDGLITASILSKKLAEGLDALVLDLKIGNGAFYQSIEAAKGLVESMEGVAKHCGLNLKIIPSDMNNPLGNYIGNWLEVLETEECLKGNFPKDLYDLTVNLAAEILIMTNRVPTKEAAIESINKVLSNGTAYENFIKWVEFQGGNLSKSHSENGNTSMYVVKSEKAGTIESFDTKALGFAAIELGAGRKKPDDELDLTAGIKLLKKQNDQFDKGEALAVIYGREKNKFEAAEAIIRRAIS